MTSPRPVAAPIEQHDHERPLAAIIIRLLAAIVAMVMFTLSKILQERGVALVEIISYRQLLALPIIVAWSLTLRGPTGFRTGRIGGHLTRTAVGLAAMCLNFASYALLPLAEATTIGFSAPIFATLLSIILLREAVGAHRWGAIAVGFMGILLMAGPASAHFTTVGVAVGLGAALGTAMVSILIRQLARTEPATVIVFWFTLLSVPPALFGLALFGQAHDMMTCLLIGAMSFAGGVVQLLLTSSLKFGAVSIVVPMDYSSIIWATVAGWLIWGTLPLFSTWLGAAIIIASGIYIVWREHVRGQKGRLRAQAGGSAIG